MPEFAKPPGTWCKHTVAAGCGLHDKLRPPVCTQFKCMYLTEPKMPERYRPDRIGCILVRQHYIIDVHQSFSGAVDRHDAKELIDCMVRQGMSVVIKWPDENGQCWEKLRYDPMTCRGPTSLEELPPPCADEQYIQSMKQFRETGVSDCLWDDKQSEPE